MMMIDHGDYYIIVGLYDVTTTIFIIPAIARRVNDNKVFPSLQ